MTFAACRERLLELAEPIIVLEMRRFRRSGFVLVSVLCMLLLLLPAVLILWRDRDAALFVLLALAFGLPLAMLVFIPSQGGRSISRERETGTWDLLMLTPARSMQISDQKMIAAAIPTLMLLVAALPLAIVAGVNAHVSLVQVIALWLMSVMMAISVSYWSVQSSCDCGRAGVWVAYLPLASYLCGYLSCGGFLVALGMLFVPQLRGQAGRMLLSALCLELVIAAFGFVIMNDVGFLKDAALGPGVDAFLASVPPALIAVAGVCLQIGALIGMRHLVPWGIEVRRRMA